LPRLETEEQTKQERDKRKRSVDDRIEDMYATEDDLKEVIRKRNVQKQTKSAGVRQIKVIERSKLLSRHVQFLDEKTLRGFLDTTTVVVVLNCESKVDAEHLEAWNIVAENFEQLIKHRLVVVGVVEAGDSTPAIRGMLGEAPSITVFRGLATPQIARYKMLDPYEDHDEYAKIRFGQGGSGTNATEVVEFVKQQIHNTLMHSVEFKSIKELDAATQNRSAKIMVMFYAPWSSEAQAIAPLYDGLAQQYRHMSNVFITRMDVSQHLKVHERMRRTKLPFFLVYDDIPQDVQEQMVAKDRKIPRILITPQPTRAQLGAFLLNDVRPDADRDWLGEWFVPYGDESHIPPIVKYTSEVDESAVIKAAHADWNALKRRSHDDADSDANAASFAATELSSWRPVTLSSIDEANVFVATYSPTRGALVFFSSSWCKHCLSQYRTFLAGASKVSSTVAVAFFNVSRTDDSKKLKNAPFDVAVFPTVLFFGGGVGKDARVEFAEKLRGPHAASALVRFIATTTARLGISSSTSSGPLPTYTTSPPSERDAPTKTASAPPSYTGSTTLTHALTTLDEVASTLSRYVIVSSAPSSHTPLSAEGAAIIFLNASWCVHAKCGAPLEAVESSTVALTKSRQEGPTAIRVSRWNLSDKRVKAFANAYLGIVAVPTIVVACNGSAHRFPHDAFPSSPAAAAQTPSRIVAFAEEVCFGLLPLELQRKRLQEAMEEAEEGVVTRMSVASLISPETGDNIFAMRFNGTSCSRDPHCIEATRLMRLLSGTYKNRQLLFASVDMTLPENEDKKHREDDGAAAQMQQHRTGSVRLVYYPAEQPPVQYEGELDRSELVMFLDVEERRSRDSRRRI
jgi:thiol-disulfide isomerase/thioredoxin